MGKKEINRRQFLKLGSMSAAILSVTSPSYAFSMDREKSLRKVSELKSAMLDLKSSSWKRLKAVPTSCLQCVAICGIIAYVDEAGRIVKIEGNPLSPNNRGMICAKGQAGINQVYDPDRLLYPLKRVGKRGEGKWQRISWEDAFDMIVNGYERDGKKIEGLKSIRESGNPELFMFHYGRSRCKWIMKHFTEAFGTKTVGNHTSICETGKWVGQELTFSKHYDINDVANSKYILNFGSNVLEAHTSHSYFAQRLVEAISKGVKVITFDVRLSNTAARSSEWIPIKPATDSAVMLAIANVIMEGGLYDSDFIDSWTTTTVRQLKEYLKQYTPEWAEEVSGVPFNKIRDIAIEFATNRPSTVITYRGAVAHFNGAMTERCAKMLDAIVGNIEVPGGTSMKVSGKWGKPDMGKPKAKKKLKIIDGTGVAYPTHHVNHMVFNEIKKGDHGRPKVYMTYVYNPVYVNGNCKENIEILKDEDMIPFFISVDVAMSESTELADLVLPDATYLERYDPEAPQSYALKPFVQIRQSVTKPLGQARAFQDVMMELGRRIGGGMEKYFPFKDSEEYMKEACNLTDGLKDDPGVKKEGGPFAYMKKYGIYVQDDKPHYHKHLKRLKEEDLKGTIVDKDTGVIWKGKHGSKYSDDKNDYKKYVGQMVNGTAYKGFKPDKLPKSGKIEIYSELLKKKGFPPLPTYIPVPEHVSMKDDEFILTSFKVNVQIHSRSMNCKWLAEIYHDNPAWINTHTARENGIKNGDRIKIKSPVDEIITMAYVTKSVHPRVVAISHHCGHWAYGRYASGKIVSGIIEENKKISLLRKEMEEEMWWRDNGKIQNGVHPNWVIPNAPDPISGQWRCNDTVVTIEKV